MRILLLGLSLLAVLTAILTFLFLQQPDTMMQAPASLSFADLVKEIETRGWSVREKAELGPKVIVIFSDRHVKEIEEKNTQRIEELEQFYDLELVALENVIEHPNSNAQKQIEEKIWSEIAIDEQLLLPDNSNAGGVILDRPIDSSLYHGLFYRDYWDAFGYEDAEIFAKIAPMALTEDIYDVFMDIISNNLFMLIKVGERSPEQVLELIAAQRYLNAQYEGYPIFEPEKISIKKEEHQAIILSSEDEAYIGQLAFKHMVWVVENALYPRNKRTAEIVVARMQDKKYTRCALVIGGMHLKVHPLIQGRTLQDYLREQGVSFLVID